MIRSIWLRRWRWAAIGLLLEWPTTVVAADALGLPPDLAGAGLPTRLPRETPGRRIPEAVAFSELGSPELPRRAVCLPEANTLAHLNYQDRRFGRLQSAGGETRLFNPEIVLVKFNGQAHVAAVGVETGRELEAARTITARLDVEFAELDFFERRAFFPNDPLLPDQWHHQMIGSGSAWDYGLDQGSIRVALVDTPFQMDHPDLAAHVVSGWDAVANQPVTASSGIEHSTLGAGMAAAVIGNGLGVAGAANCQILPININGAISEMYQAAVWAADHGVRVVNISWTGGDSDTLNQAGAYLKSRTRGILAMAGGNLDVRPYVTNQPDIYCISMTDAADNMQSLAGPQVDFAAPGWNIFSTTTGGGYGYGSGTSYATPLFCGVVAVLFSINPTLGPDDVVSILRNTAATEGWSGWNRFYGWGRIDFGAAAAAAAATLPVITSLVPTNGQVLVSATYRPGATFSLWRSTAVCGGHWASATNASVATNGATISFLDPSPVSSNAFYRVGAEVR